MRNLLSDERVWLIKRTTESCLRRCCKENGSQLDMAVELLDTLPETDAHVFLQMDSRYTCQKLWNKASEKSPLIGVMKTNHIRPPLTHYIHSWKIEVVFKQQKMYSGLETFMVRSAKAIDRQLVILPLTHFLFMILCSTLLPLYPAICRFRGPL